MHAHEQEAHVRQRLAERFGCSAVLRQHDQPADLRRAVVVVADAQRRVDEVAIERDRVALVVLDAKEDVRRALRAVLRVDHRRADDPFLLEILEHEHELALGGRQLPRERARRSIEQAFDRRAIGRQVDGVEVLGDGQYLVDIFAIRLAEPEHGSGAPYQI